MESKKFNTAELLADIAATSTKSTDEIVPIVAELEKETTEETPTEEETPKEEEKEVEKESEESVTDKLEEEKPVVDEETQSEETVDDDSINDSWDSDSDPEVEGGVDITSVLSDVGIEATTKGEAKEYVQNLKSQVEQLQAKTDSLGKLPKELVDAIEIANQGGDYLDYLNVTKTDYSAFDPTDVWLYDKSQYFIDPTTQKVDEERLNEYAEKIGADQIRIEGTQIRNELVKNKDDKSKALLDEAASKKRKDDETLKEVLSKIDSISNYKLTSSHKQGLYSDISSGRLMKDLYYGEDGELDFSKMVINGFKAKFFDKIDAVRRRKDVTSTTKKIVRELANVEVRPPAEKPVIEQKTESGLDLLMGELKDKDRNRKIF